MNSSKRKSMIFYRFGEIPKNEKSCIWRGEEKIGKEKVFLFMKPIKI